MYCDSLDLDSLLGPVFLVHGYLFNVVQHLVALQDFAKDCVLAVEVRSSDKGDEELRAVGVGALVGHADDASCVVSQGRTDLIFEELVGSVVDGGGRLAFWI